MDGNTSIEAPRGASGARWTALLITLGVLILGLPGCGDMPMAPAATGGGHETLVGGGAGDDVAGAVATGAGPHDGASGGDAKRGRVVHLHARDWFEPELGGTLELDAALWIEIPRLALPRPTVIVAHAWLYVGDQDGSQEGRPERIVFEFRPHLEFVTPIWLVARRELVESMLGDDGAIVLWYLDPKTHRWVESAKGEDRGETIWFPVEHFSKYALSR